MKTTVSALKALYESTGGSAEDVKNIDSVADMIYKLAEVNAIKDVIIQPESQSKTFWGTAVSAMQGTDITINDNVISGTLKYVESGTLVTDWNTHHFIALKFSDINEASNIKIGIKNLVSLDEDMNAVIAIESSTQILRVQSTVNGIVRTQEVSLNGLTLADA